MEDKRERIIDLADKKPRLAIIYILVSGIISLAGVILYQNGIIRNFDTVKDEAVKAQAKLSKAECTEQLVSLRLDVKELKEANKELSKTNQDLNDRIVSRTDNFVDRITHATQSELDNRNRLEAKRAKTEQSRKTYRAVTEEKIKQLQTQIPNEQSNEK